MIVVTTPTVPGRDIDRALGVCRGNVVRAKHIGKDLLAGLRSIGGGEIDEYTQLMTEARDQAAQRMIEDAQRQGADAIVNVRFASSMIAQTMSELLAYGTAGKLTPPDAN